MKKVKKISIASCLLLALSNGVMAEEISTGSDVPITVAVIEEVERCDVPVTVAVLEATERCDVPVTVAVAEVVEPCDAPEGPYVVEELCEGDPLRWWMNFGVGAGTTLSSPKVSGVGIHYSFNGNLTPHMAITFYKNIIDKHHDYVQDTGILLGYVDRNPKGFWSASTGLAYYYSSKKIDYDYTSPGYHEWGTKYETNSKIAIPVQVQAFWTPFRHFGIGVIGHAVVVPNPYVTALLAIQIT